MTRLLLASRNPDKVREIQEILAPIGGFEIVSLDQAGIARAPEEEAIEASDTFLENARAKAVYFAERTGLPTLADDSGIGVDALDGRPGVRSRRFSGRTDLDGIELDRANNETLLTALRDVPDERRGAAYVCAAVCRRPDGVTIHALGSVRGQLLHSPRGQGGFGYDPLFYLPALGRTFGEVDADVKHAHSHRARAFRALATELAAFLEPRRMGGG